MWAAVSWMAFIVKKFFRENICGGKKNLISPSVRNHPKGFPIPYSLNGLNYCICVRTVLIHDFQILKYY